MKDTVICCWNSANKGKSGSIVEAYKLLLKKGAKISASVERIGDFQNPSTDDNEVVAVLDYKEFRIGIESYGDPNGRQFTTLKKMGLIGCNMIICASRTNGHTCNLVCEVASKKYDLVWFSNFYDDGKNQSRWGAMHKHNARCIVDLVDGLIAGNV